MMRSRSLQGGHPNTIVVADDVRIVEHRGNPGRPHAATEPSRTLIQGASSSLRCKANTLSNTKPNTTNPNPRAPKQVLDTHTSTGNHSRVRLLPRVHRKVSLEPPGSRLAKVWGSSPVTSREPRPNGRLSTAPSNQVDQRVRRWFVRTAPGGISYDLGGSCCHSAFDERGYERILKVPTRCKGF